jgi:hypothetical protein
VTCPAVRLPQQTKSSHRRSGIFPGRRFALAAVLACVAAAGGGVLPATAAADQNQTVVSATVFPGTAGNYSIQPIPLSKLAGSCPTYDGPLWTFPDGQGPLATATAWSLGDVITCGLGTTQSNVTAVKVFNGDANSYESTLLQNQVFNPDTYPSGALPLISIDGSITNGGAVTYTRPPADPSDQAQSDQFTEDGTTPVSIDVYENQLPLQVTAAPPAPVSGSATASSEEVTLAATVTTADGAAIDPSQLTWNWSFGGSPLESAATPTVSIGAGDSELASVIVTDQATGAGGTATVDVAYNPSPPDTPPTTNPTPGAGNSNQGAPTGQNNGKKNSNGKTKTKLHHGRDLDHAGTNKGGSTGHAQRGSNTSSHVGTTSPPVTSTPAASTPTPTTPPPATSVPPAVPPTIQTTTTTTGPGLTVDRSPTKTPPHPRHHVPKRRSTARPGASQRLVTGRLVADVQALPEGESPLVHPIAAQAAAPALVHAAGNSISAPTWAYATLAVLALLGGGALYERRGRRGRTLHR